MASLLWVNHDADNMKARPHRHRVFAHVQNSYRPWERRQKIISLRASAKVPRLGKDLEGKKHESQAASSTDSDAPSPSILKRESSQDGYSHSSSCRSPKPYTAPLSTTVGYGNSDPFGVYSISITPEVNNLMAFYRDFVLPSIWYKNFKNKNTMALAARQWQYKVTHLEDRGTAYGIIACHSMMAAACSSDYRRLALQYVGQSTQVLRRKIDQGQDLEAYSSSSVTSNTAMLFQAGVLGRDLSAATAHGGFLGSLFKQQWMLGRLDFRLLMYEVYTDCQLTSIFLCAPVFDVEKWLPMVYGSTWSTAAQKLPCFPSHHLDPAIDSVELQTWFRSRQEQLHIYGLKNGEGILYLDDPIVMTWFFSKAYIFHGHMIIHYLKNKEKAQRQGLRLEVKDHLCAQQYMALAAIYLTRGPNFNFNPTVLGIPMYDAAIIPRTLRSLLEMSEMSSNRTSLTTYRNARLWAFYVGALVEQDGRSNQAGFTNQWFTDRLIELAARLGVMSWPALQSILRGFLYSEISTAQGSIWFERLMAMYYSVGA